MNSQEQQFHEWLSQCPVQWFLLDSDYDQKSYQFIVDSTEEDSES
jgi:hypothetical protein